MKNKELLHERRDFENVRALIEWAGDEYAGKTSNIFVKRMSF